MEAFRGLDWRLLRRVLAVNTAEKRLSVDFDGHVVGYEQFDLQQLTLTYAITIRKSQGSEFPVVVVPAEGEQPPHHVAALPAVYRDHLCAAVGGAGGRSAGDCDGGAHSWASPLIAW